MKNYNFNTFIAKNDINVSLKVSDNFTFEEINMLSVLWGSYCEDIICKTFDVKAPGEFNKYLSGYRFGLDAGVNVIKNDVKTCDVGLNFNINLLDIDDEVKNENFVKVSAKILELPLLDDSFTATFKTTQSAFLPWLNATEEIKTNREIAKQRYFSTTDDYYSNGISSKLYENVLNGLDSKGMFDIFNSAISKLKDNIVSLRYYTNGRSDKIGEVISLIKANFVPNPSLNKLVQTYNLRKPESKFIVKKTTAESIRFFSLKDTSNYKSAQITRNYIQELFRTFYLEEIRLKHNLIYSPNVSISRGFGKTTHEVKQENIEKICSLEDEFYAEVFSNKIVEKRIFDNCIKQLVQFADMSYEQQDWNYIIYQLDAFGVSDISSDVDTLFDQYNDLLESLTLEDVDFDLVNYDSKSIIVGE